MKTKTFLTLSVLSFGLVNAADAGFMVDLYGPDTWTQVNGVGSQFGNIYSWVWSDTLDLHVGANTVNGDFEYGFQAIAYDSSQHHYHFDIPFTISQSLTLNGITKTLVQKGVDSVDTVPWDPFNTHHVFHLYPATVLGAFEFPGSGYRVNVSVPEIYYSELGDGFPPYLNPPEMYEGTATFTVQTIPDTSATLGLLGLGLVGISTLRRRFSNR